MGNAPVAEIAEVYRDDGSYDIAFVNEEFGYIDFYTYCYSYRGISEIPWTFGCVISSIDTDCVGGDEKVSLRLWFSKLSVNEIDDKSVTMSIDNNDKYTFDKNVDELNEYISSKFEDVSEQYRIISKNSNSIKIQTDSTEIVNDLIEDNSLDISLTDSRTVKYKIFVWRDESSV